MGCVLITAGNKNKQASSKQHASQTGTWLTVGTDIYLRNTSMNVNPYPGKP